MKSPLAVLFLLGVLCSAAQEDSCLVTETGIASYYARAFEGRRCSSGQIFKHQQLTAAHKHIKFGTRVKVTNLKNDSVVVVTINDRLPPHSKRSIDLTRRAASQLNFIQQGLARVKIDILPDSAALKPDSLQAK